MNETASSGAALVGINHIALEVGEIDTALKWYGTLFEFDLRSRSETKAFIDMGDQFLALATTEGASDRVDRERHVGLVVADADVLAERIEQNDVEPLDVPGLEIRDPWGNRLQIVEYGDIQFTKADHILDGMGLAELEKSDAAIDELREKGMAPSS